MSSRLISTVAAIIIAGGMSACAPMSQDVVPVFRLSSDGGAPHDENAYERGKRHYEGGYFGLAVREFQIALVENPNSIEALNGLAASYDRMGRFDLSERYYHEALSLDKASTQTLNNLGFSYYLQQKPDVALAILSEAASRDQTNNVVANNKSIAESKYEGGSARTKKKELEDSAKVSNSTGKPSDQVLISDIGIADLKFPRIERTTSNVQTLHTDSSERKDPNGQLVSGMRKHGMQFATLATATEIELDPAGVSSAADEASVALGIDTVSQKPLGDPRVGFDWFGVSILEVSNGTGRRKMASRIGEFLEAKGLQVDRLTNAVHFNHAITTIFYREGQEEAAKFLQDRLPVAVQVALSQNQGVDLRIELGADLLKFDSDLFYGRNWRET